ncbi:MAG: RNA polymerase sigma factor, partial [Flavobacteriales bacterium]|nr:RNA polymerase sigma factor [Flavobacteriales bacterium]
MYAKSMFNVCYRIVNQHDEAQDVLQESFIKMFNQIDSYREESSFGAWFKRIVVNSSLNHIKKRNKEELQYELLKADTDDSYYEMENEGVP